MQSVNPTDAHISLTILCQRLTTQADQMVQFFRPRTKRLCAIAPEELSLYWTHKYWNANPQLEEKQICLTTLYENQDMIKRYFNIDLTGRFYDI